MKYNIIATDLDGTLLTSNKKITPKTKKVLDTLKESGYFIVGVTARNLSSVQEAVNIKLFDYLILSNGSDIYDVDKEIIKNYKNVNVTNMSNTDQLNSKFWLIINPNGINKLKTLELLCDDLKTIPNKVIFFGDGENDLPIIKGIGLGIAMKNAENIVKENADDITLSNDKEGVANYLEKYLIEKKNSKSDK